MDSISFTPSINVCIGERTKTVYMKPSYKHNLKTNESTFIGFEMHIHDLILTIKHYRKVPRSTWKALKDGKDTTLYVQDATQNTLCIRTQHGNVHIWALSPKDQILLNLKKEECVDLFKYIYEFIKDKY